MKYEGEAIEMYDSVQVCSCKSTNNDGMGKLQ